jgi:hypothetical protein
MNKLRKAKYWFQSDILTIYSNSLYVKQLVMQI